MPEKPDCDFYNFCGEKATTQVEVQDEIKNVCELHANDFAEDVEEDELKEFGIIEDEYEDG